MKRYISITIDDFINEQFNKNAYPLFYHGTTSSDLTGKNNGIHVGSKSAASQALHAKIGIPVEGYWDGTREYGKTLLAGKKTLEKMKYTLGYDTIINFNAMEDVPEEDYYPRQRKTKACYFSTGKLIPIDSKPIILQVMIIGEMSNTYDTPYSDALANSMMYRYTKHKNAKSGYYYINEYEDKGSISAVVPDSGFLLY